VDLAKKYMKQVLKELDSRVTPANDASLLAHSMRFTYRAHQVQNSKHCMYSVICIRESTCCFNPLNSFASLQ
jgi:hypothetical protein